MEAIKKHKLTVTLAVADIVTLLLASWVVGVGAGYAGGTGAVAFGVGLLATWVVFYVYIVRLRTKAEAK